MPKLKLTQSKTTIIVAVIGLGSALISGYFMLQAAIKPIQLATSSTQTAESRLATESNLPIIQNVSVTATPSAVIQAKLESIMEIYSSWQPCTSNIATVLPNSVLPKENSYNTISELPDYYDFPTTPIFWVSEAEAKVPTGTLLPARISIWNSPAPNEQWIRVSNIIKAKLDLASPYIEKHLNLLFISGSCGGDESRPFSDVVLNHDIDSLNQTLIAESYDFFSIQPGEFVELGIDFVCATPGIYKATTTISVESLNISKSIALSDFGTIICPDSYSLWRTEVGSSDPLEYIGEFFWNGKSYDEK